jgi:phosphotransferase system HPr (HPr) family protein
MKKADLTVANKVGLHARPAALFVKTASQFGSDVKVRNVTGGGEYVNAKSILKILSIGVSQNHQIEVTAEGADEDQAVAALTELVQSNFGE